MKRRRPELPRTARDSFSLRPREWVAYEGLIALCRTTGVWKRPIRAEGDFERMGPLDKIYWLYKARYPIERPRRGSGLEHHFRRHGRHRYELPAELRPECRLTLSAAGDLIHHPYLARSSETLYERVASVVFGADVPMANLECPVVAGASVPFEFATDAPPALSYDGQQLDVVAGYGERKYALVSTANNHSLDYGADGVDHTIDALRRRGIAFHGTNPAETNAGEATLLDRRGVRLGVIAFTFGLNGKRPPADRPRLVNRMALNACARDIDFRPFERQLEHCRRQGADFVVAQLHWGMEHEMYPTPEQVGVAHELAELGADAIIGHHPHVIQPVEHYRTRRDPERVVPIHYSLGNLVNPFSAPWLCRGRVAHLELVKGRWPDGSRGTYVARADASTVVQQPDHERRVLRLVPSRLTPRGARAPAAP